MKVNITIEVDDDQILELVTKIAGSQLELISQLLADEVAAEIKQKESLGRLAEEQVELNWVNNAK